MMDLSSAEGVRGQLFGSWCWEMCLAVLDKCAYDCRNHHDFGAVFGRGALFPSPPRMIRSNRLSILLKNPL